MSVNWRQVSRSQTLDSAELSAQAARELLRGICADARMPVEDTETALLLVSEVVTNAVTHGDGRPVVDIDVQQDRLRVSVTDEATGVPRVQRQDDQLSEHGRGLFLVENLAARWGITRRLPVGKSVWFELDRA